MTVPRITSLGFVLLTLAHPWASVAVADEPAPRRTTAFFVALTAELCSADPETSATGH